jgi:hypothetical protein
MAVGTMRQFMVEGITYPIAADAAASQILSKFENSLIPTSGKSVRQMTKRVPAVESFALITTEGEADQLKQFSESVEWLRLSYTTAKGASYSALGQVEFENRETDTGRTTLQLLPEEDWVLFDV